MSIYTLYRITNTVNSKVYIGWTSRNPDIRFGEHQKRNKAPINHAIKKYGVENFRFEILYQSTDYEHSRTMESVFIQDHNSLIDQWGYNQDKGGTGHKRTQATIDKHRRKIQGRKQSAEHIEKRKKVGEANAMFGRKGEDHPRHGKQLSEEQRNNIKEGRRRQLEAKGVMSEQERKLARRQYTRKHYLKKKQ